MSKPEFESHFVSPQSSFFLVV